MGAKQQTYATIREAFAIIANARLSAARGVADPDRYHARILTDLRAKLHEEAVDILETATSEIDGPTLAAMLDAKPAQKPDDAPNPSSAIPDYTAEPWTPLDRETRQQAKAGLAEARAARDRAVAAKQESSAPIQGAS